MKKYTLLFFAMVMVSFVFGQSKAQKAVISTFEGFPSTPFEAADINERNHTLSAYKDKVVVLSFWNTQDEASVKQTEALNKLYLEYGDLGVVFISLAEESTEELLAFRKERKLFFPIIPNSKVLADNAYAGELGNPRVFIIDQFGLINKVLVTNVAKKSFPGYEEIKGAIDPLLK